MTVTFGGIIRDMLLNEFPASLKAGNGALETVFIGAGLVGLLLILGVAQPYALLAGFLVTFGLRVTQVSAALSRKGRA
jgi:uncharacterized membrane protein YeiH